METKRRERLENLAKWIGRLAAAGQAVTWFFAAVLLWTGIQTCLYRGARQTSVFLAWDGAQTQATPENWPLIAVGLGLAVLSLAALAVVLCQLSGLCRQVRRGHSPFTGETAGRMKFMAVGYAASTVLQLLSRIATKAAAGRGISIPLRLGPVLMVLILLALSVAFEYGAGLQRQADETL